MPERVRRKDACAPLHGHHFAENGVGGDFLRFPAPGVAARKHADAAARPRNGEHAVRKDALIRSGVEGDVAPAQEGPGQGGDGENVALKNEGLHAVPPGAEANAATAFQQGCQNCGRFPAGQVCDLDFSQVRGHWCNAGRRLP